MNFNLLLQIRGNRLTAFDNNGLNANKEIIGLTVDAYTVLHNVYPPKK